MGKGRMMRNYKKKKRKRQRSRILRNRKKREV